MMVSIRRHRREIEESIDYTAMAWNALQALASERGVTVYQRSREDITADLIAQDEHGPA